MIFGALAFSFLFAFLSLLLSKKAKYAFIGMSISLVAIILGGSNIEVGSFDQGAFSISLDWLILEILALSLIFIPLELSNSSIGDSGASAFKGAGFVFDFLLDLVPLELLGSNVS